MNTPSLALIPSGYKENKLYSVLPANGDGDFDFSRNSTATRINKNGLIESVGLNVPRLDYKDSQCPILLLEPERTNYTPNSEPTSNDGVENNITYDAFNWAIGFNNCINFQNFASTSYRYFSLTETTNTYTLSAFILMDDGSEPQPSLDSGSGDFMFVMQTAIITSGTYKVENYGNNIYRVSISQSLTASGGTTFFGIAKYSTQTRPFKTTGLQLEIGTYPTSYIPTSGSAVTRFTDSCNGAGNSDLFDFTEGTMFFDLFPYTPSTTSYYIDLSSGSGANRIYFRFFENQIQAVVTAIGVLDFVETYLTSLNQRIKLAITFKQNDFKYYVNGSLIATDTSGNIPVGIDRLDFYLLNTTLKFEGKIYDGRIYNTALTQTEAENLTSL